MRDAKQPWGWEEGEAEESNWICREWRVERMNCWQRGLGTASLVNWSVLVLVLSSLPQEYCLDKNLRNHHKAGVGLVFS